MPKKPDALIAYELITKLGIPLVDGGLVDQPFEWLAIYQAVDSEVQIFERMQQRRDDTS